MLKKYLPEYIQLLRLGMPLVLTQAGQTTIQLIDNAMVGRFGTAELAAVAFAGNVYIVVMLLGLGIFMGITPLVGHARGARDDRQVAATMKNSFVLSGILIPAITLVCWAVTWMMPYLGQDDEVVHLAVPYYQTLVVAIIPFLLFALLKQIGEGLGNTFVAMVVTILCILIKVGLNYILIFGNLGFPELGLMGAGYATIVSRAAMPVLLFTGNNENSQDRATYLGADDPRGFFLCVQCHNDGVDGEYSPGRPRNSHQFGWLHIYDCHRRSPGSYHPGELSTGPARLQ
jgi:MATE family multidrug resistance protein